MSAATTIICPINGLPARVYCRKDSAIYYIEPNSGTIFQAQMPSVGAMNDYADQSIRPAATPNMPRRAT